MCIKVVDSSQEVCCEQAASKQQASSSKQQQAASSKQQQAASSSKQKQAAGKQQARSNQRLPPLKEWSTVSFKIQLNTKIELFPGARPQNNEIVQLLKVVVMPNLNFFQAHGLPIRLLQADTT